MLHKRLIDFKDNPEYRAAVNYFARFSGLSPFGGMRDENTHSDFIAVLLNPQGSHGLGDFGLRSFLSAVAVAATSYSHSADLLGADSVNAITAGGYTLSDVTVEREKDLGEYGRLDIYVQGKLNGRPFRLAIENKVDSAEHDEQTVKYFKWLNPDSFDGLTIMVYLTPLNEYDFSLLDAPECACKSFIQLNYQLLADYVLTPCKRAARDSANGALAAWLDDYLFTLGKPARKQGKGDSIMAISKEARDAVTAFWQANRETLTEILQALTYTDALDEDEQVAVRALVNPVKRRYTWNYVEGGGGTCPSQTSLIWAIIAHYVGRNPGVTLDELKAEFPDKLMAGRFGVVASIDYATERGVKYYYKAEPIQLADCVAVVCNQWKQPITEKFIAHVKTLGYEVTPE